MLPTMPEFSTNHLIHIITRIRGASIGSYFTGVNILRAPILAPHLIALILSFLVASSRFSAATKSLQLLDGPQILFADHQQQQSDLNYHLQDTAESSAAQPNQQRPNGASSISAHPNGDSDYYYYTDSSAKTASQHEVEPNTDHFGPNIHPPHTRLPNKEYLSHDLAEKACRLDRGCQRKDRLNNTYLSNCARYKLENLLSNEVLMSIMHDSVEDCDRILEEFIQLDELINQFDTMFKKLLTRYNCHNGYSVKWSCEDCKKAYTDWLCATNLPYYMNGERIKPCISFCERVEQRCPYLHPITKEQYGGQPVFICRDPNIPFVPEITQDIPYSEPTKCYDLCHLSNNITELITDSLSKYDYTKCPDKGLIAEEVRSDPLYCHLDVHQHINRTSPDLTPEDEYNTMDGSMSSNRTVAGNRNPNVLGDHETKGAVATVHAHKKKLNDLMEVLHTYKNQPKVYMHTLGSH